jgi:proton glutamate symport protein
MKKIPLHWKIIAGMAAGILCGWIAAKLDSVELVTNWIRPFGEIFVNSLKLIAVPLILTSLIKGVTELRDISSLSRMGLKSLAFFITTTLVAATIGLTIANLVQPGMGFSEETRAKLSSLDESRSRMEKATQTAESTERQSPLQGLVDIVPANIFDAATDNSRMLQVIFFAIFFGVGMILIKPAQSAPLKQFVDGANEVVMKMIDIIMLFAPFGVFALMASQIAQTPTADVLLGLLSYSLCVVAGLAIILFLVYPSLLFVFAGMGPVRFFRAMAPAQLMAFSTSSSAATLPVTMERVEEHLGVDNEVASFVLPVGATINMDGTCLYQAVAAVFIAQAYNLELSIAQQISIVATATLASIGSAAVPGAGMVMLVIVLKSIGVPVEGLALIIAVDRILDMCRTTINVTGDAMVSVIIANSFGKLHEPRPKSLGDNPVEPLNKKPND